MKKVDHLLDAIGNARSNYIMAAQEWRTGKKQTTRKKLPGKRLLLIAAIIALALLLMGCVAYVLGLQDLFMGTYSVHAGWGKTVQKDFLSMQGFSDSPNYQANKEWQDFLDTYDPDGTLLKQADANGYLPPAPYESYTCYTPEMEAKVDEICEKYNLKPLGPVHLVQSGWEIFLDLNIPSIFSENTAAAGYDLQAGYYYEDGTFQFDGCITQTGLDALWKYPIDFTYRRVCKTSFDGVYSVVEQIADFDQWQYTAPDGTQLILALGDERAFLLADTPDHFITISTRSTRAGDASAGEQQMTREAPEAFADLFGFTYTSQEPATETLPEPTEETLSTSGPDLGTTFLSYSDYINSWLTAVTVHPEAITYTLHDLNGNGTPELIIRGEETLLEIVTSVDGITSSVLGGYTEMNLCDGNIIESVYSAAGREDRTYYKIMGREAVIEECLMHSDVDDSWYWSPTGGAAAFNWTEMAQDAYEAVRGKYPYIQDDLVWTPITEYPTVNSEFQSRLFENLFLPLAGGEYLNGREQFEQAVQRLGYEFYIDEGILYVEDPENPGSFLSGVLSNRYGFDEIHELYYCYVNHCVVKVSFEDREAPRFFTAPDLLTEPNPVETLEKLVEFFYRS